jgi:hypothetical protein
MSDIEEPLSAAAGANNPRRCGSNLNWLAHFKSGHDHVNAPVKCPDLIEVFL